MAKRVLITGASGFIGSFLVEAGLEKGYEVWAAVRPSSSRRYLQDSRIRFITIDLEHEDILTQQLLQQVTQVGAFDFVIHAAGATKARSEADFERVNTTGTLNLARVLLNIKALTPEGRFVFISSLSVYGPVREKDYLPIVAQDIPQPDTAYGRSKLKAEQGLQQMKDLNLIILRPTGVYGPREKDYLMMIQSIIKHIDFSVGYKRQIITFIYVRDLVEAAYLAFSEGVLGKAYFLTDGGNYSSRDFSRYIQQALNIKYVLSIKAPLWFLKAVCLVNESISRFTRKMPTLNTDKYHILKQRNWQCDIEPARKELNYQPQYPLAKGVKETIDWCKRTHQI